MLSLNWNTTVANMTLALVSALFLYSHVIDLLVTGKLSLLITVITETILVMMFLIRKNPISSTSSVYDYFIAIFGTFSILLYRPNMTTDILLGQLFLTLGGLFTLASYISINRSFGLVPANRGIKTKGLYSFVRHPIYFSYPLIYMGYYINNPSRNNLVILVIGFIAQVLRILREEAHLIKDVKYVEYRKQVPWILVPYVF